MAQTDVKVSVIMPAHNAAPYIREAVQSVLKQKGIHFELLIGDDASTDKTSELLKTYEANPNIRLFKFRRNRGPAWTRNRLIASARGAYLAFCDADDVMLAGHLKKLSAVLDEKSEAGAVYGDLTQASVTGKKTRLRRSVGPTQTWDLIDGSIGNVGTMVRRNLIRKIKGYRTELPFLEDCDLFLRLAEMTHLEYIKSRPTYIYHKRPGSLSRQPKKIWAAVGRKIVKDAILRRYGVKAGW